MRVWVEISQKIRWMEMYAKLFRTEYTWWWSSKASGKWERLFNKMYEGSIIKMCFCLANPFFVSIVTVLRLVCKFNYSLIQFMCFYPSSDFFISPFLCFFFVLAFYFYLRLIFAYIRQDLCVCACVSLLFWSFHLKLTSNT